MAKEINGRQEVKALLSTLMDEYSTESNFEPKAHINGCTLSKAQLTAILAQLDEQATSDYGEKGLYTTNDITLAIDDDRDVYVTDGKRLDGETIKVWMDAYGVNMSELARRTGLTYQTVYNAVTGKSRINEETTEKIANALKIGLI